MARLGRRQAFKPILRRAIAAAAGGSFKSAWTTGANAVLGVLGGEGMLKNVASQKIGAQLVSATDGSAFTGSVTVSVTVDAGTQATGSVGAGACTHEGNGYHTYAPAQAETNGDLVAFTFTGTGAVPATVQVYTLPATGILAPATLGRTLVVDAAGLADANAVKVGPSGSGTAQTARDIGASVLLSSGTGTGQVKLSSGYVAPNWGDVGSPTTVVDLSGTTVAVASAIGTNGITSSSVAASALGSTAFNVNVGWRPLRANTAQAGGASTITLDASASSTTDFYKGAALVITGGTGVGQAARIVTAYDGTTKVATVTPAWATAPDNTSTFAVLPGGPSDTVSAIGTAWASGAITAASIASDALTAAKFAADCITAAKIADGAIDAATFAAGAINAAAIAADAITDAKVASDVTIASVTGAVGSVTGNVGGNVVGSVASVVGAVGSVTGNVGGNVTGSVGSVVGAVGSVTGAVGSVTARVTANVDQINATSVAGTGTRVADAFVVFFNVASSVLTTASVNQTGDSYGRLGAPAGASVSADVAAVKADTASLLSRITSTLFSGITYMGRWLGLLAGKTADSTTLTEVQATTAGAGFNNTTDSLEAIKDSGGGSVTVAGYASGQDPATLVLGATAASWNTSGTIGQKINSAGAAADPLLNAVPGSYASGTAGAVLGSLASAAVTVVSPLAEDGTTLTIIKGDDYDSADSRAISWSSASWPSLASATIAFVNGSVSLAGSVVGTGSEGTKTVRLEMSDTQSATLSTGRYRVVATQSDGDVITLVTGLLVAR